MHDDRTLVEGRLERALQQFVRPAQYAARTPLALSAWHVPGEPVPVADALDQAYEPFVTGTAWGKPWSTTWFRLTGSVPEEWSGRRVEVVVDPGFSGQGPGFQAEGMLYGADGVPSRASIRATGTSRSPRRRRAASRSPCSWRRRPTPPCWSTASNRPRSAT